VAGGFLILGIAGGVGSGKSAVARILAELGFVVSDSDAGARAVLGRAEVVEELVEAFGPGVLDADGRPDRRAIADAVFGDDAKRRTLEGIIHPRLHEERARLVEAARAKHAAGVRGVVIDAPLLFEAGVDKECDAVIFVDTPGEIRLRRVVEGRGWTEAELLRREAAQMPLDMKRDRSDAVVVNDGDLVQLRAKVLDALEAIEHRPARDRTGQ
jgi:dephospho-CoA kinase